MAQIVVRVTDEQRAGLEEAARRAGVSLSEHVRQRLDLDGQDIPAQVADLQRRLARLEKTAPAL